MALPRALVASLTFAAVLAASPGTLAHADGPQGPRKPAADVSRQAQELLDNGVAMFKAGDLERARIAFARASALVPDKPNPYRWLGLIAVRNGQCAEALTAFDAFLQRVAPGDARTVEVVTLRDRCRVELEPKVGTLVVASTPPGAEVRLRAAGDPLLGTTPLQNASMPAGSHIVVVRRPGYVELSRGITVVDKEVVRLDLVLEPIAAPPTAKKKRYWIIGAVLGPVAAVGLGVGLGVSLTRGSDVRTFPSVTAQ